ncbi:MAG: putative damage-inducible protein DinB [Luteibaculaceae bacterium]|jgi:uncharacterized damage-inducible protein DinB
MSTFSSIVQFHLFEEGLERIQICLNAISDNDLYASPNTQITPIGNQIVHLIGNISQWLGNGVLGLPYARNRNWEFDRNDLKKSELLDRYVALKNWLLPELHRLDQLDLHLEIEIQGFTKSNAAAIIHVLEHFSYHIGQISLLTKLIAKKDLGYYSELDLNL